MRKLPYAVMITATAILGLSSPAMSKNFVAALSPQIPKAEIKTILEYTLEQTQRGEAVTFYDASSITRICQLSVPDKRGYNHKKVKMRHNKKCIVKLLAFPKSGDAKVNLPKLVRAIGKAHHKTTKDILLVANPLYRKNDAFGMIDGERYPGDGHLQHSVSVTPYGVRDHAGLLKGKKLHIVYPSDVMTNEQYESRVHRFYGLMINHMGGQIASWTHDLPIALDGVQDDTPITLSAETSIVGDKLEMINMAPVKLQEGKSIFQRSVDSGRLSQEVIKAAKDVQIGIKWDCQKCDLDLHVRPHASAKVLYFGRTKTSEGRYWKDFLNAPEYGFETIDLSGVTDLRDLLIAVNFYGGTSTMPVSGEIRLTVGDKTYAKPFQIKAMAGNRAKGSKSIWRKRKSSFPQWIIIDPMLLVNSK